MADEWKIKTSDKEWSLKEEGSSLTSQILEMEKGAANVGAGIGAGMFGIGAATPERIVGIKPVADKIQEEAAEALMEKIRPFPESRGPEQFLGEKVQEYGVEFPGKVAAALTKDISEKQYSSKETARRAKDQQEREAIARTLGEFAINVFPLGLLRLKPTSIKPKVKPSEGIPYDSSAETSFPEMQVGKKQLSGQFDTRLTTPDMPGIDWDTAAGYSPGIKFEPSVGTSQKLPKAPELKLRTIKEEFERQQIVSSQGDGIPFREMTIEDPKAIEFTQSELAKLSVKADVNETRLLISQMKGKIEQSLGETKRMFYTITNRIKPIAIDSEVASQGYKAIHVSPMAEHIELVPTQLMELMRHTDRLTNPEKGFLDVERSVLKGGVNKGVSILYWPEEGRIVQDKRNVVRSIAAKHGMEEIPAYVKVMPGRVSEPYNKTAVSIPGLIRNINSR